MFLSNISLARNSISQWYFVMNFVINTIYQQKISQWYILWTYIIGFFSTTYLYIYIYICECIRLKTSRSLKKYWQLVSHSSLSNRKTNTLLPLGLNIWLNRREVHHELKEHKIIQGKSIVLCGDVVLHPPSKLLIDVSQPVQEPGGEGGDRMEIDQILWKCKNNMSKSIEQTICP